MFGKNSLGILLVILLFLSLLTSAAQAADTNTDNLFIYIGDSLMNAKSGNQQAISENISLFESEWKAIKKENQQAEEVDEHLLQVKNALEKGNLTKVKSGLSSLSGSLVKYDKAQN